MRYALLLLALAGCGNRDALPPARDAAAPADLAMLPDLVTLPDLSLTCGDGGQCVQPDPICSNDLQSVISYTNGVCQNGECLWQTMTVPCMNGYTCIAGACQPPKTG
jgi:hypothetical protein